MIFLAGLLGFALGFLVGQMILAWLLRHRSRESLLTDGSLRWTYGTLNWVTALAGMAAVTFCWKKWMGP